MDSKEKADFINHLRYHIKNDKEGYKYFVKKWNQLDEDNINSLKNPLIDMCIQEMQKEEYVTAAYFEFQNVVTYFQGEFKTEVRKFNISNAAKKNEIVKIFIRLKDLRYISNSNEEMAHLISIVFDIKYTTALSYINKPSKQVSVRNLLG